MAGSTGKTYTRRGNAEYCGTVGKASDSTESLAIGYGRYLYNCQILFDDRVNSIIMGITVF